MAKNFLFTSESVSEGHPDKLADQISDAILDAFLALDPNARVACETVIANQFVLVAGEFKTKNQSVYNTVEKAADSIVRSVIRDVGYTSKEDGIDPDNCEIKIAFNHQSSHINQGVDLTDGNIGAGDQGLMFGYACDETPELMPLAISLSHKLVKKQAELRRSGKLPWLRPDAKSQVSVRYVDGRPLSVEKVVLSTQHSPDIDTETLRIIVREQIVDAVIPPKLRAENFEVLINPTGKFEIGGPNGDTGLTGRKIIVDTYGGSCPHGGGAFSGKDPSKVDRSAAYMARYIAKNIVASGQARKCLVQLAYAIGITEPVSLMIDTFGTGIQSDEVIEALVRKQYDLTPKGIIDTLDLKRPIYRKTATYGHFGRAGFSWEDIKTEKAYIRCISMNQEDEFNQVLIEWALKTEKIIALAHIPEFKSDNHQLTLFARDISLCVAYLNERALVPIFDSSINLILHRIKPETPNAVKALYSSIIKMNNQTLETIIPKFKNTVWITLGTSLVINAGYKDTFNKTYNKGRIFGIAGVSALNGGYGGLKLLAYFKDDGNNSTNKEIIKFDCSIRD